MPFMLSKYLISEWVSEWRYVNEEKGITGPQAMTHLREYRPNNPLQPIRFHCRRYKVSNVLPLRARSVSNFLCSQSSHVQTGPMTVRHGKHRGYGSIFFFFYWFYFPNLILICVVGVIEVSGTQGGGCWAATINFNHFHWLVCLVT